MAERLNLREGFTTGSAATGAALAALHILLCDTCMADVSVPLPPFDGAGKPRGWLSLAIAYAGRGPAPCLAGVSNEDGATAHAAIIKDGGDDPDVTSGLAIECTVTLCAGDAVARPPVALRGGPGVGQVTLPGLPVPPGEAAINPVPREQIRRAVWLWLAARGLSCPPLTVTVSVPRGETVAQRTFNPRLGIVGGISILGTQGTVRPYSHDAFRATIAQGLAVAHTVNADCICLTTGRRSEKLLMGRLPHLTAHNFVQVADFAQFSLARAGEYGFGRIVWGCFFGKLLKLAQGLANTHAHEAETDMSLLAALCRQTDGTDGTGGVGVVSAACVDNIRHAHTAAQAQEILLAEPHGLAVLTRVAQRAAQVASGFAGQGVEIFLFHTDGRCLCGPVPF